MKEREKNINTKRLGHHYKTLYISSSRLPGWRNFSFIASVHFLARRIVHSLSATSRPVQFSLPYTLILPSLPLVGRFPPTINWSPSPFPPVPVSYFYPLLVKARKMVSADRMNAGTKGGTNRDGWKRNGEERSGTGRNDRNEREPRERKALY